MPDAKDNGHVGYLPDTNSVSEDGKVEEEDMDDNNNGINVKSAVVVSTSSESIYGGKEEKDEEEASPMMATHSPSPPAPSSRPGESLNRVYGNRWGMVSSISLILNAGLMVYAHVGLSAVILSNQQRIQDATSSAAVATEGNANNNNNNSTSNSNSTSDFVPTGNCAASDNEIWISGGNYNKSQQSNWCAREYGGNGCLLDAACATTCFVTVWNYTTPCAQCFADVPVCSLGLGCGLICQENGLSEECSNCIEPCNLVFDTCSGLERPAVTYPGEGESEGNNETTATSAPTTEALLQETNAETCARQQEGVDAELVDEFYIAYELQFFSAIKTAWNSDAKLLAVIVVIFSGIWPYAKNIILALAWYLPLSIQRRDWVMMWLRRLGKYTLVDIYVVILIMVGVSLEINVADGVPLVIKAEPRPAIIAFLVATVWEFIQIEWIVALHEKLCTSQDHEEKIQRTVPAWYREGVRSNSWTVRGSVLLLWIIAVGLLLTGSIVEAIRFTSVLGGETAGCVHSYNLYELGAYLWSDFFLLANTAKPGVWTMAISYVLCLAVFPLYGHMVHALSFWFDFRHRYMCIIADQCWTFASVEVLVLAIFTVEYKFSQLIASLAGNEGSQFFGINTNLGPGFFILMVYSLFGGLTHYFFNMRLLLDTHDDRVGKQ